MSTPRNIPHGIFMITKRNIERICEIQQGVDYYQMQHFISDAKWDARAVINNVDFDFVGADALYVNDLLFGIHASSKVFCGTVF